MPLGECGMKPEGAGCPCSASRTQVLHCSDFWQSCSSHLGTTACVGGDGLVSGLGTCVLCNGSAWPRKLVQVTCTAALPVSHYD